MPVLTDLQIAPLHNSYFIFLTNKEESEKEEND